MRARGAAVLFSLVAFPLFPQTQTLVESIEVRVANIDVVVRDRAGNPVNGLTKDDFELFDDGVPQKITNFYEVRRGESTGSAPSAEPEVPVEVRQRRVVVLVDAASLTPSRTREVLKSLEKFIDGMRPEDRVTLVVWRLGMHVVTPFTNDRTALKHGLDGIARYAPAGESSSAAIRNVIRRIDDLYDSAQSEQFQPRPLISWQQAYNEARTFAQRYAEQLIPQQKRLLDAVEDVAQKMAGMEGKKVLVFVGEHFPQHPGAELYRYVENRFSSHLPRTTPLNFEVAVGVPGDTTPASIEDLAKSASANGVTIYAIGAATDSGDISSETGSAPDRGYTFSRDANTAASLQTMAALTGGVAITRTSNFDLAFDTIDRDLASYYSLGYKPIAGDNRHKVVVKTKNREYSVRARQTFVTKSTDEQMMDRVIANLYVDPAGNEWPISLRTGRPNADGKHFAVPVQVVIPSTITLLPDDANLSGGFVLYFVAGDAAGGISPVMRRPETLRISRTSEALVRAKPMTFTTTVGVNAGESTLSVAIVDQLSGAMGFARTTVIAR